MAGSVFGFWVNFGELVRRAVTQAAVRPLAVVFVLPLCDLVPSIGQVSEPSSIQTFISQSPVEAFHVTILGRLARLDVNELDSTFFTPAQEMATR